MAFTKVAPAGIGSTPGDGYRIGDSFLHSTGVEITNINATGIVTAASLDISGAIDFDGQTNLDHVSITGVTTMSNRLNVTAGIDITASTSNLYATDGALSYYATNNGVYLNGAGANGWLRLQAAGSANDRTSINLRGHSISGGDSIYFRTNSTERLNISSTGSITVSGTISPTANNTYDLGGSSNLWRHLYVNNVNISGVTTSGHLTINGDLNINDNYPSIYLNDTDSNNDFMLQNQNGIFTVYDVQNNADRFEILSDGTVRSPHYTLQSTSPSLTFNDTNHDSDFMIQNANGLFKIFDNTNGADRFAVNSSGSVFVYGNELYIGDSIIHHGDTNTKIRFPAADTFTVETAGSERLRITSTGVLNVPAGIGPQLRFENQHSVTTDAAISTFDDASGTLLCIGSNLYVDSSGSDIRYNTSEESTGILLNRQGYINLKTGSTGATAVTRVQITETGKVQIGLPGATGNLAGGVEVVNIRAASNANLIVRNIGSLTSSPAGSGVGIDILNDGSNTVMDLCLRGHTVIFRNRTAETLRITGDGNITFGVTNTSTAITSAAIKYISGGRDYWNSTKGDYRALRFRVYDNGIDDQYGMGVSSGELELQAQGDIGFYASTGGSGLRALRFRLDASANSLDFETNTKLYLKGTANNPQRHASINIGSNSSSGETRAIDVWGSWGAGENKSITFNHGSNTSQMVGQINCIHNSPGSSMRWGKLYHAGDSSTYTMSLDSTSTTGADLTLTDGNLKVASGHGIDFSATANYGTSTPAELLDDYEEGTWTPTAHGYTGSNTNNNCHYTKIGRLVVASFRITWPSLTNSTSAEIRGLPFTAITTGEYVFGGAFSETNDNDNLSFMVVSNSTKMLILRCTSSGVFAQSISAVSGKDFRGTVSYFTNS